MINTPNANRLHIGIFGKTNSGKSSFINFITNQNIALVSDIKGTTTDPVYKAMEIQGIGPCVFIDTAGFDDLSELGERRIEKTNLVIEKTDFAIMLFSDENIESEKVWIKNLKDKNIPILYVINKCDILKNIDSIKNIIYKEFNENAITISSLEKTGFEKLKDEIIRRIPKDFGSESITGSLVKEDDVVLLVMPQDIQAPKGRLILPQVQTIRDLLDNKCIVISCTTDKINNALTSLKNPPKLIITDSQAFKEVYEIKPKESNITSFSVLLGAYKGDIKEFIKGAKAIDSLNNSSKVLILEACTHAPLEEDIGRVKIPKMLRKRYGEKIEVDIVSGADIPKDLSKYNIIIHCGACMFNRKHVISRIEKAKAQGVPITNYGVVLAKLCGILDKVDY